LFLNFQENEILVLDVFSAHRHKEPIERIGPGEPQSVLFCDFELPNGEPSQFDGHQHQEVVDAEESLEVYLLKGFNDMSDQVARTVGQNLRLVEHYHLLILI
jgi:hypothetical protein